VDVEVIPRASLRLAAGLLAGLIPFGLAAAWIPARSDLPNTDAALLLVVCVAGLTLVGGPVAGMVGAVTAVLGFDFFDTAPYGQLLITGTRDVVTAFALLVASLVTAGLAVSLRNHRSASAVGRADFNVMAGAARLVSVGEGPGLVVSALAGELVTRLDLGDCEFVYGPLDADRAYVTREGTVIGHSDAAEAGRSAPLVLNLPVWTGDTIRGYYRLTFKSPAVPPSDRLLVAVGISEQAGAALATQLVDPGPAAPAARPRRLRLVR
jgi:hypothetical protein